VFAFGFDFRLCTTSPLCLVSLTLLPQHSGLQDMKSRRNMFSRKQQAARGMDELKQRQLKHGQNRTASLIK